MSNNALKASLVTVGANLLQPLRKHLHNLEKSTKSLNYHLFITTCKTICTDVCQSLAQSQIRLRMPKIPSSSRRPRDRASKTTASQVSRVKATSQAAETHIALIRSPQTKELQWAMVRSRLPKTERKRSASSNASTQTLVASPVLPPSKDHAKKLSSISSKSTPSLPLSRTSSPSVPQTQRSAAYRELFVDVEPATDGIMSPEKLTGNVKVNATPQAQSSPRNPSKPHPVAQGRALQVQRLPALSIFSFESDSTKLGEIPMHRWPAPYDFDQQSQVNAAATNAWTQEQVLEASRTRKPGLWRRLFKRTISS